MNRSWSIFACLLALVGCKESTPERCDESPGALYEKRVAPLLDASRPNTCSQCHAGGINLESFLRSDPCESMACLQAEGLVNLKHPAQSVLLSWIERAEPQSELITEDVIKEEYEAFLSWIEHEAECGACADAECTGREPDECERSEELGATYDQESDPGDCDRGTIEKLFRGTAYAERDRCSPCHYEEEEKAAPTAPRWLHRTGACNVAALATLRSIEDSGYINADDPENSLLMTKPLAEFQGGLEHGGHDKFVKGNDSAYNAFLYFLKRYGACATDTEFVPPPAAGGSEP